MMLKSMAIYEQFQELFWKDFVRLRIEKNGLRLSFKDTYLKGAHLLKEMKSAYLAFFLLGKLIKGNNFI